MTPEGTSTPVTTEPHPLLLMKLQRRHFVQVQAANSAASRISQIPRAKLFWKRAAKRRAGARPCVAEAITKILLRGLPSLGGGGWLGWNLGTAYLLAHCSSGLSHIGLSFLSNLAVFVGRVLMMMNQF